MPRSGWGSLQGWTGSAEAREVSFPEGPGVLETGLVFSPSGAWAIKGGAPQGCWRGEKGDRLRCPSRGAGTPCLPHLGWRQMGSSSVPPPRPQSARGSLALVPVPHFLCHLMPFNKRNGTTFPSRGPGSLPSTGGAPCSRLQRAQRGPRTLEPCLCLTAEPSPQAREPV